MIAPGLAEEENFEEGERRAAHQGMEVKWLRADAKRSGGVFGG